MTSFYFGKATPQGRVLDHVWRYSYSKLESDHLYIQYLFPTKEKSASNPTAPILSEKEIESFKTFVMKNKVKTSFEIMMDFYGFSVGEKKLKKNKNYFQRLENFLNHPHNFLRITRILTSLMLLNFEKEAFMLGNAMLKVYSENPGSIPLKTLEIWMGKLGC